ncbi:MAG: hypothetical protein IKL98_03515, partial [Akkermansia sp.]|nr:hypothetical protein [Akkermansia sp.]
TGAYAPAYWLPPYGLYYSTTEPAAQAQSHFAPHGANHQRRQAFFLAGSCPPKSQARLPTA